MITIVDRVKAIWNNMLIQAQWSLNSRHARIAHPLGGNVGVVEPSTLEHRLTSALVMWAQPLYFRLLVWPESVCDYVCLWSHNFIASEDSFWLQFEDAVQFPMVSELIKFALAYDFGSMDCTLNPRRHVNSRLETRFEIEFEHWSSRDLNLNIPAKSGSIDSGLFVKTFSSPTPNSSHSKCECVCRS